MTSAVRLRRHRPGLLLLLLLMMMMTGEVVGLTCFSCTSTIAGHGCADPFDPTADGVGRCVTETSCVAARMTGGSLGKLQLLP